MRSNHLQNQTDLIYCYLLKGNTITQAEAIALFKCYRLSGRIYDIKSQYGDIIEKEQIGQGFAKYRIKLSELPLF